MAWVSRPLRFVLLSLIPVCLALPACDGGGGGTVTNNEDGFVVVPGTDGGQSGDSAQVMDAAGGDTASGSDGTSVDPDSGPGPQPDAGPGPQPDAGPGPGPVVSGPVDSACLDGQYTELLPTPQTNIDAIKASYSAADVNGFILSVLDARYPIGSYIVEQALIHGTQIGDCVAYFAYDTSSAQKVIDSLSTVTHECGHFLDLGLGGWGSDTFVITDVLTLECEGGDKFEYGGNTFPRSELMGDTYAALRPQCAPGQWGGCDSYADVYLVGDSGNQGFNTLMEEAVQYVNSLATGYSFNDQYVWTVSEKDGILTFLWYMERYLYLARTQHPSTHSFILASPCYRELILTVWGRAWMFLELTKDMSNLGMEAQVIEDLVMAPELLAEIEAVRDAHGCP